MHFHRFNLILGGLALSVAGTASADVLSGPIVNPTNGHSYYLLEQDTWTNSEAFAQSLGGHLVTINDAEENQWVYDTFASFGNVDRNLWIGFNDVADEGTFVWSSGETPGYTNWAINKPDGPDGADYGHIISPAGGFSARCGMTFPTSLKTGGAQSTQIMVLSR